AAEEGHAGVGDAYAVNPAPIEQYTHPQHTREKDFYMPRRNRHHAGAANDHTPALCTWSHGSTTPIAVDVSKTGPVTHGFEFDRTLTEALEEGVWSLPLSVAGELDLKKWNRRMKAHRYYVTASAVLLNALLDRRSDSVTEGLEQLQYSF